MMEDGRGGVVGRGVLLETQNYKLAFNCQWEYIYSPILQ